jgi:hypothetical protein
MLLSPCTVDTSADHDSRQAGRQAGRRDSLSANVYILRSFPVTSVFSVLFFLTFSGSDRSPSRHRPRIFSLAVMPTHLRVGRKAVLAWFILVVVTIPCEAVSFNAERDSAQALSCEYPEDGSQLTSGNLLVISRWSECLVSKEV